MSNGRNYGATDLLRRAPVNTRELLKDAVRISKESEEIGEATLEEMRVQRDLLEGASYQLEDMKSMTTAAQDTLSEITNQDFRQRLCLWIVIIALFVLNVTVLVIMINNNGKLYTTSESIVGTSKRRYHSGGRIDYVPVSSSPRVVDVEDTRPQIEQQQNFGDDGKWDGDDGDDNVDDNVEELNG